MSLGKSTHIHEYLMFILSTSILENATVECLSLAYIFTFFVRQSLGHMPRLFGNCFSTGKKVPGAITSSKKVKTEEGRLIDGEA